MESQTDPANAAEAISPGDTPRRATDIPPAIIAPDRVEAINDTGTGEIVRWRGKR